MLKTYIKAFGYASSGIASFVRTERNAKLHLMAAVAACATGAYLGLAATEWLWIASAITLVIVSEMINSAIEKLCNRITTEQDSEIGVIKDIAAGFVLVTSFYALVIAAIIFTPKLF
ncbi:MAG: diacylglycerol kinase family protein [Bacteroidia bacterium]|jgi:diacylglycerol kinase|tara:strand:- start:95 stop:445 length:351 start_codon:yes stop_codon:yes gene_type:complete